MSPGRVFLHIVAGILKMVSATAPLLAACLALNGRKSHRADRLPAIEFTDHLLLDEHGDQLFAMTDDIAERVRKVGGTTLRSIGQIARVTHIADNDADYVTPKDMLSELWQDNKALVSYMKSVHVLCDDAGDVASSGVLENWIDEARRRAWFLYEICRDGIS